MRTILLTTCAALALSGCAQLGNTDCRAYLPGNSVILPNTCNVQKVGSQESDGYSAPERATQAEDKPERADTPSGTPTGTQTHTTPRPDTPDRPNDPTPNDPTPNDPTPERQKSNASGSNGKGGNYDRTGHADNGKGNTNKRNSRQWAK